MAKVRAHVFVKGLVQGVFFRQETRRKAESHGVRGWVRNLDDGRVEAVFEGEEADVKALVDFCRQGPKGAQVTDIDLEYETFSGGFQNFKVAY